MNDLYIPNKTMEGLHKQHIKELKKQHMWDAIIRTRQNIIESNEVEVGYFQKYNPWDLQGMDNASYIIIRGYIAIMP